eukprot:scaffold2778_cov202-Prasinococcus_capsulatus_cf.AAC.1
MATWRTGGARQKLHEAVRVERIAALRCARQGPWLSSPLLRRRRPQMWPAPARPQACGASLLRQRGR